MLHVIINVANQITMTHGDLVQQPISEADTPFLLVYQENDCGDQSVCQAYFVLYYMPAWPSSLLPDYVDPFMSFTAKGIYEALSERRASKLTSKLKKMFPNREQLVSLEELGYDVCQSMNLALIPLDEKRDGPLGLAQRNWNKHGLFFGNLTKRQYFERIKVLHEKLGMENSIYFIGYALFSSSGWILPGTYHTAKDIAEALEMFYQVRITVCSILDTHTLEKTFSHVFFGLDQYGEMCSVDTKDQFRGCTPNDTIFIPHELQHDFRGTTGNHRFC